MAPLRAVLSGAGGLHTLLGRVGAGRSVDEKWARGGAVPPCWPGGMLGFWTGVSRGVGFWGLGAGGGEHQGPSTKNQTNSKDQDRNEEKRGKGFGWGWGQVGR